MPELPTGTVTFLLTDVEGSTRLWEDAPNAMEKAIARHDELMAATVEAHGGVLLKHRGEGDSTFSVFHRATDAISAALATQLALAGESWTTPRPIRARAGLHSGEAELRDNDYYGQAVNRCARLRAIGYGGQVLLSQTTTDLVRDALPANASLRDLGPQRLKDLARAEQVFQLCHPELSMDFPALRSLDRLPNNLPVQLTSFIGRERDVAEVADLLSKTRLLTLTGAGGCGKTRLALQVAAELLDTYPDGVWVADLAPVIDPDVVLAHVAAAVGVREEGSGGSVGVGDQPAERATGLDDRLIDSLRSRRLLLVLDNCEHLVAPCAQVADTLLHACPELDLIVTTREPLGITGEVAWRVPSLAVPDPKHVPPVDELESFESVQLFCERAAAARPTFELTADDAEAVATICHRLDGIPLAVELAAAKVQALTTKQIAERLGNRFRLLTGGSRTALARQQTLRALVDWSHELLDEGERALLRRLSVFTGGFTLEAAEEVCPSGDVDADDVLDLVQSLVRKSLVQMDELETGARYRLLETIRQYARDKLLETGEGEDLRTRHRDFFLDLAERAEPELRRRNQGEWFELLELEHDNLRTAIEWSVDEAGGAESAMRLCGSLRTFWNIRGYISEGRRWLDTVLALEGEVPAGVRAKVLVGAGSLTAGLSEYDVARPLLEEGVALYRRIGDQARLADALRVSGYNESHSGDNAKAIVFTEEALVTARESGDATATAMALNNLGAFTSMSGDWNAARPLIEEALVLLREVGDMANAIIPLRSIALFASMIEGDPDTAKRLYEEALDAARSVGAKQDILGCLHSLGDLALSVDDYVLARTRFEEALAVAKEVGIRSWLGPPLDGLGDVALWLGDTELAQRYKEERLALERELNDKQDLAVALFNLAWTLAFKDDWEGARPRFEEAVELYEPGALMRWVSLAGLAYVSLMSGDNETALRYAEETVALVRPSSVPSIVGLSLRTLGDVLRVRGDLEGARAALSESLELVLGKASRTQIVFNLESSADVAAAAGDAERAARLYGAVEAIRRELGVLPAPGFQLLREPMLACARSALGDTFDKVTNEGRAMSFDDAVAYALGKDPDSQEKS